MQVRNMRKSSHDHFIGLNLSKARPGLTHLFFKGSQDRSEYLTIHTQTLPFKTDRRKEEDPPPASAARLPSAISEVQLPCPSNWPKSLARGSAGDTRGPTNRTPLPHFLGSTRTHHLADSGITARSCMESGQFSPPQPLIMQTPEETMREPFKSMHHKSSGNHLRPHQHNKTQTSKRHLQQSKPANKLNYQEHHVPSNIKESP